MSLDNYRWEHQVEDADRDREELAALRLFKSYVHKRLDDAGVPVDPDSPHKAEGCRIGGRLDHVFAAHARLQNELADARSRLASALVPSDDKGLRGALEKIRPSCECECAWPDEYGHASGCRHWIAKIIDKALSQERSDAG